MILLVIVDTILLIPRNVGVSILKVYQKTISPLYGEVCRYYPSCSQYTKLSIQNRGLLVGSWCGLLRILKCNPWSKGGVSDVPISLRSYHRVTKHGFVVTSLGVSSSSFGV